MIVFRKDQTIFRKDVEYRVGRPLNEDEVQLEAVVTGEISNHKTFNLLTEYTEGTLLTATERRHELLSGRPVRRKPARMDNMSSAAKVETRRRIDYLVRLEHKGSFGKTREELRKDLFEISVIRKEQRAPHESTVYRWRRRYLEAQRDIRAVFCRFDKQGGKNGGRLQPEVEGILTEKIEKIVLGKKRWSAEEVHNAVFLAIQHVNTLRVETEWLPVPGLRTVQRRIAGLYAFELAVARFGEKEAERRFANHLGARSVSRILELVEMDHSPLDILVTDVNRVVIGRPTITVLLDRMSRRCLGYHLSLAGHGVPAVFAAIRHALLPKTYLSKRYADLNLEWNCYGWPETILMDNGSEFHSEAVADALRNIGISVEFAESRNPNDKPHVERFLKTLNYSFIHRLPGTTLAKVHERIGFKAEAEACLTLDEVDRMLHVWLCTTYHVRKHSGLDERTPLAVWDESARAWPPQLKANAKDLDVEFSQFATSALQHYGIDLNTFVYVSTRLLAMRRMLPEHPTITVKWPSDDAGHVQVWDPIEQEYFRVPNKDDDYDGLTVEQAKAAKKAKANGEPSDQRTMASGAQVVYDMVDDALADKKLKNRRKGARLANMTSKDSREEGPAACDSEAAEEDEAEVPEESTPPDAGSFDDIQVDLPEPHEVN